MATLATFLAHGSMLEGERSALVAMALEAAGLVCVRHPLQAGFEAAVRIMAVGAGHRIFGNPVFEGLRKGRFDVDVAALALGVDVGRFAVDQSARTMRVDRVARRAGDGVAGVAGFEAACRGWLIAMTSETCAVDRGQRKLQGIPDVGSRERLDMLAAGSVTGFAGFAFEAVLVAAFHGLMRAFRHCLSDIFMARPTGLGADIGNLRG